MAGRQVRFICFRRLMHRALATSPGSGGWRRSAAFYRRGEDRCHLRGVQR